MFGILAHSQAKLASMMGGAQLAQCYSFFLLAGTWTRFVTPAIATMTASVSAAEGKLLEHHARVADYGDEIAQLRGGLVSKWVSK